MSRKKTGNNYIVRVSAAIAALLLLLLIVIIPGLGISHANSDIDQPDSALTVNFSDTDVQDDDGNGTQGVCLGICPLCYEGINTLEAYVECRNCFEYVPVSGKDIKCDSCGTRSPVDSYSDSESWIYHQNPNCESLIWYPWFAAYNSGTGQNINASEYLIPTVRIKGEFDSNGDFNTYPWYTYESLPSKLTANLSGEYAVIVYGGKGERLAAIRFDPEDKSRVISSEGFSSPMGGVIPVELNIRFSDSAKKIVILKGDKEIYSRDVSDNTPEVNFTGYDKYKDITDRATITWEASDADGDGLFFELWYCLSDNERYLLASDIKDKYYKADFTDLPGKQGAYFQIYATDGVRTAEVRSQPVNVKYSAPAILTEQSGVTRVKITEEIYYPVKIYDSQDGWLSGNSVSWMLDGEEVSITSVLQTWPYQLEPGQYTFTCIATNSAGLSAQKDYIFEIIDDESDLPDDWSRPEIIHALKNGYIVQLNRIEAPVPRGQFADLMFMLYYYAYPDGLLYYDETLIKDCGANDYSEFLMVALGLMEAKEGYFEPQKSLTEREALRILYLTWMLTDSPGKTVKDIVYSEKEAKELFLKNGIFDKIENVYQPDEKLSKKSALVWISRMDKWVFPEE